MHGGSVADVDSALVLLKKTGGNINSRNAFGLTALHIATWRNHIPIIKRLLAAGADPNARVRSSSDFLDFLKITSMCEIRLKFITFDETHYYLFCLPYNEILELIFRMGNLDGVAFTDLCILVIWRWLVFF